MLLPGLDEPELSCGGPEKKKKGFKPLFDNFFSSQRPLFSLSHQVWNPPADLYETNEDIVIKMEIAGVCLSRLDVTADRNYLFIRGCRGEDAPLPKEDYQLMEIRYGRFERVFTLPFRPNADEIKAEYRNGFLVVRVTKRRAVSREIAVQVVEDTLSESSEKKGGEDA